MIIQFIAGLSAVSLAFFCAGLAQPKAEASPHAEEVKSWREDLTLFAAQLPIRHANAFHRISPAAFKAQVAALNRKLGALNADQFWVGLQQIESAIGDGHTFMRVPKDAPRFGLRFKRFGDDYRLIAAAPGVVDQQMLGAKLKRVDGVGANEVHRRLLTLGAQDERLPLRELRAEPMLSNGLVLHGLGIAKARAAVIYTLEDDGGRRFDIHAVARPDQSETDWAKAAPPSGKPLADVGQAIQCRNAGEPQTLYCEFRSYDDLQRGAQAMFATIQADGVKRLILDLRRNGGGDFCKGLDQVVKPLALNIAINRPGGLYVLIGPETFSAAMSNTAHFRQLTQAILVGQPIGEKPNSYQEIDDLILPRTGWTARYSTKFYHFWDGGENIIRPDVEIDSTWDDYKRGADPVLAYIRALPMDLPNPPVWRTPVAPAEGQSCATP